ncbi:MAG: hypothetical protein Q8R92_07845 [Deltaproteobacteria bacterium]|nr:hypothetical protein [Deltaproteobacteria bacterium]
MFEIVIIALLALGISAAIVFGAAFVVLAVTPLMNEETPSRLASPAMAQLWASAGAPVRGGFVSGLVRGLATARAAIQGRHRDATS